MEEWIYLKFDDKCFVTELGTLLKDKDSMLYTMFCKENRGKYVLKKDRDDDYYLFDRSGKYFEPILEYLRTGSLIIDYDVNKKKLFVEANFYNIREICNILEPMIEKEENENEIDLTRKEVIKILVRNDQKKCLRFQGLNLKGVNLSSLDLSNINMKYCNLANSILDNCNLNNVNFEGANLERASLKNVNFCYANAKGVNLSYAKVEKAECIGTNFMKANLAYSAFKNCKLNECNFMHSDLSFCDLSKSSLTGCKFKYSNLKGINRNGTNLSMGGVIRV